MTATPDTVTRWQPIETAPKDGTHILICRVVDGCLDGEMEITHWFEIERSTYEPIEGGMFRKVIHEPWRSWNGNGHRATHWMPLPEPPQ